MKQRYDLRVRLCLGTTLKLSAWFVAWENGVFAALSSTIFPVPPGSLATPHNTYGGTIQWRARLFCSRSVKKYHLEQWLLYPLQDETVALVARNTQQLSMIYQLVTQDWSVIRWANDKRLTYQMAQELDIAYPKT